MEAKKILSLLLCGICFFAITLSSVYLGHHQNMIVLEYFGHSLIFEILLLSLLATGCLLSILLLQFIKICSGFKLWFGKYRAYNKSIEDEALRIQKQKESLENGE